MKPFRILSFDGGGICGLYSIVLLARLLQTHPQLVDQADLLAGTSTGGIIALCLAKGLPVQRIIDLYQQRGQQIFDRPWWRCLTSPVGLSESKYVNTGLIAAVTEVLGPTLLGQLPKKVVIPAFDLKSDATPQDPSWRARFFHNLDADDAQEKIVDVALRTSAAPTYFPAYQGYVDGGVVCNDPSVLAVTEAIDHVPGLTLADISVLSIGTGGQIKFIDGQDMSWGGLKWLSPIVDIFMGGQALVTDAFAGKLLGDRYSRLCTVIPSIQMDEYKRAGELVAAANSVDLSETLRFLDQNFYA